MERRVLVVDDEIDIVEGLTMYIRLEQVESAGALDRASAAAILAETYYPVVIADLCLQTEEDGQLLVDEILRSSRPSRVVVLSGRVTPEMEEDLLRRGVSLVLAKPSSCDVIMEAIQALLLEIERESGPEEPVDLERLYLTVRKKLYGIPFRRFHLSHDAAEDVIQEAWLLFLQKRALIRTAGPWLSGTVANLSRKRIDQLIRRRESHDEDAVTLVADAREIDATDVLALRKALKGLDDRGRALCELIGVQGLSYDEVSTRLDLPLGSIGPLYIRAKNKLRKALSH